MVSSHELHGCDFPTGVTAAAMAIPEEAQQSEFSKTIKGEAFIDQCTTRFDVRHFHLIDVKDINIVLVSTFQELFGVPFLT